MKYIIFGISIITISTIPLFFRNSGIQLANFSYDICSQIIFITSLSFIYTITSTYKIKERAVILLLIIGFANTLVNYVSYMFSFSFFYIHYIVFGCLFLKMLYNVLSWDNNPPIHIHENESYFVFKKPRNLFDFVISLFRSPVSSFSIISNNKWYKFSKGVAGLQSVNFCHIDRRKYHVIEIISLNQKLLKLLIGKKWSVKNCNCVTIFKELFLFHKIKLRTFDFIPSIFAYRYLKHE